jgi:hypothetical protein
MRQLKKSSHEIAFVFTTRKKSARAARRPRLSARPGNRHRRGRDRTATRPKGARWPALGGGPAIIEDAGMLAHTGVKNWMMTGGERQAVISTGSVEGGSTDARDNWKVAAWR